MEGGWGGANIAILRLSPEGFGFLLAKNKVGLLRPRHRVLAWHEALLLIFWEPSMLARASRKASEVGKSEPLLQRPAYRTPAVLKGWQITLGCRAGLSSEYIGFIF